MNIEKRKGIEMNDNDYYTFLTKNYPKPEFREIQINPKLKVVIRCQFNDYPMCYRYKFECVFDDSIVIRTTSDEYCLNRLFDDSFMLDLIEEMIPYCIDLYRRKTEGCQSE